MRDKRQLGIREHMFSFVLIFFLPLMIKNLETKDKSVSKKPVF